MITQEEREIYSPDLIEMWERRINFVEKLPDDTTFFIQNGHVGNSVLWWARNGSGYTTDPYKAHEYDKQFVLARFAKGREEDKIWVASHVKKHVKAHVDAQYLDHDYKCD